MTSNRSFHYPEYILDQKVRELKSVLGKAKKSDKEFVSVIMNPKKDLESEIPALNKFLDSIKNPELRDRYITLIENFRNKELYERFLASILIYNHIDGLPELNDKFLYICIAVEAAMHFESNHNKKKSQLFKSFFKTNLSRESKLKLISNFKNKNVYNVVKATDLVNYKRFGGKLRKYKSNTLLPSCYHQKNCFVDGDRCYPERFCYLNEQTDSHIDGQLDLILSYLYTKRSDFVHEGRGFYLESKDDIEDLGEGGLLDLYHDYSKNEDCQVFFTLYIEDFLYTFKEALLNHVK